MMNVEEGAGEIVDKALEDYESYFEQSFPLYEHLDKTKNEAYDISLAGAKRLSAFISERIEKDEPVKIPHDYENRVY